MTTRTLLHTAWLYSPHPKAFAPQKLHDADGTAGGLVRDAGVVFEENRILRAGRFAELERAFPDAGVIDCGETILLPGLINAHTHLELSNCSNVPTCSNFPDWVLSLPGRIGAARDFAAATREGIRQSLQFGVTTVGDISQQTELSRPVLARSPLRAVSYGEALGLSKMRANFDVLLERAIDRSHDTQRVVAGLTPHAPYTVDVAGYRRAISMAHQMGLRLATHLAELPYEREFMKHHAGPLRELYERIGSWTQTPQTFDGSPIEFAHWIGLLEYPALLAHVNYCSDDELDLLAAGKASVVYCPRTHDYFGHPAHRFCEMLERGVNVAIGTDSCASSPDLNLVDELRLVHREHPEIPVEVLFEMVTTNAARALQMEGTIGALVEGYQADFTLFPVNGEDPLRQALETEQEPVAVWIGGEKIERGA